jgi:hypothetical protein
VKQRDDNAHKHAQAIEARKLAADGTKKRHKAEVSELKLQLRRESTQLKDELKGQLKVKESEKAELRRRNKLYKRGQKSDDAEVSKLQVALGKEKELVSSSRSINVASHRDFDALTVTYKECQLELKKLKKKTWTTKMPSTNTPSGCSRCRFNATSTRASERRKRG